MAVLGETERAYLPNVRNRRQPASGQDAAPELSQEFGRIWDETEGFPKTGGTVRKPLCFIALMLLLGLSWNPWRPQSTSAAASNQTVPDGGVVYFPYVSNPMSPKIAFISDGYIYTMNVDGTRQVNLTTIPAYGLSFEWSPDGTKIAYMRWDYSQGYVRNEEIYVINADRSDPTYLASVSGSHYGPDFIWSPDSTLIAFVRDYHIFTIRVDGTGETQLTLPLEEWQRYEQPSYLTWSPDGTQIGFVRDDHIFTVRVDGTGEIQLTPDSEEWQQSPRTLAWSPDGVRIMFSYPLPKSSGIAVVEVEQKEITYLGCEYRQSWSPDGSKIACGGWWGYVLMIMNHDGTNRMSLNLGMNLLAGFGQITWSPDGSMLASSSFSNIYRINVDFSDLTQLTQANDRATTTTPYWSPDGTTLLYSRTVAEKDQIFTVGVDGRAEVQLTHGESGSYSPRWQPRP